MTNNRENPLLEVTRNAQLSIAIANTNRELARFLVTNGSRSTPYQHLRGALIRQGLLQAYSVVMKVVPPLAAAIFLVCFRVRAESSCAAMIRLTNSAESALKGLNSSARAPKGVLQMAARDLEIATNAARGCSDRDAKQHLAAVKAMLSDMLLTISDTTSAH